MDTSVFFSEDLFFSFDSLCYPFSVILVVSSDSFFYRLATLDSSSTSREPAGCSNSPFGRSGSLYTLELRVVPVDYV